MKITIAYLPEEEKEAARSLAALLQLYPKSKIRRSETHPPHKHTYISIPTPKNLENRTNVWYNNLN